MFQERGRQTYYASCQQVSIWVNKETVRWPRLIFLHPSRKEGMEGEEQVFQIGVTISVGGIRESEY